MTPAGWGMEEAQRLENIRNGIGCAHGRMLNKNCEPCSKLERCSHGILTFMACEPCRRHGSDKASCWCGWKGTHVG